MYIGRYILFTLTANAVTVGQNDKRQKIRWPYILVLGLEPKLDHTQMHNLLCAKQPHLKYFGKPLFCETEAKFGSYGNFHKPSHTKGLWKIAKPPKYCSSFSKQRIPEKNFSLFWIFFPGSTLKIFHGICVAKYFIGRKLSKLLLDE